MGDTWLTPPDLADDLGPFDTDPCGSPGQFVRATRVYTGVSDADDGLRAPWPGTVFCNPPYSDPGPWAALLAAHDGGWCALVKLDPTTAWWRVLMSARPAWAPFRRRIRFFDADGNPAPSVANFPCALVWRGWWPSRAVKERLWMP